MKKLRMFVPLIAAIILMAAPSCTVYRHDHYPPGHEQPYHKHHKEKKPKRQKDKHHKEKKHGHHHHRDNRGGHAGHAH